MGGPRWPPCTDCFLGDSNPSSYLQLSKRWKQASSVSFDLWALLTQAKLHSEPVHLRTHIRFQKIYDLGFCCYVNGSEWFLIHLTVSRQKKQGERRATKVHSWKSNWSSVALNCFFGGRNLRERYLKTRANKKQKQTACYIPPEAILLFNIFWKLAL